MKAPKPVNFVFVTDAGMRVPVDLRYVGSRDEVHIWEPVLEGDVANIMSSVIAIDADCWPPGAGLHLPAGPGYDDVQWGLTVLANSPILAGYWPG